MTPRSRPRDAVSTYPQSRSALRASAFSLLELVVAVTVLTVIAVPLGHAFIASSRGLSSLAARTAVRARAPVLLDRVIEELRGGSFSSLHPEVPVNNPWIRIRQVQGFTGESPVYGNPVQIDLEPGESGAGDGVDDDGDGLVDEMSLRIWEDVEPHGSTPGSEDEVAVIASNLSTSGLSFTREGALIEIVFEVWISVDDEEEPRAIRSIAAVHPRNP